MRQQKTSLFVERVDEKAWLVNVEGEPEITCIHGPYMNQRIVKEVYDNLPQDRVILHAGATTHHDQHWDHPGKRARISPSEVKRALNADEDLTDDCTFIRQSDLRIRRERRGYLISQNNCAYFVNNDGGRLLKFFGDRVRAGDVKTLCEKHGIPDQPGMEFFRRLITFGLYRPV